MWTWFGGPLPEPGVRVDMTEEFPFLVTWLAPLWDGRTMRVPSRQTVGDA
jgi:hypothetical protein